MPDTYRRILTHDGREINDNAVDYGDGMVMVSYKDTGDVAIIRKSDIKVENRPDDASPTQ